MKTVSIILAALAAIVAVKRIAESKRVCLCAGPFCACGNR